MLQPCETDAVVLFCGVRRGERICRAAAQEEPVKAVVYDSYGSPDVLALREIDQPVVRDDQVLLRIRAASLNAADWHLMRGLPYLVRLINGLRKPSKTTALGGDLAGQVESVGKNVTQFRTGDEVFGRTRAAIRPDRRDAIATGGCAEYACVSDDLLVPKPANLTFEQAAAVPLAGLTALQALRDKGGIQSRQKVLINGASGGVGTFAVQIAKSFGADVTGVCSTSNMDMVRSIGADQVIDYTHEDFTKSGQRYDLILDIGDRSLSDLRRTLTPRGTLVIIGGSAGRWINGLGRESKVRVLSPFVSQRLQPFLTKWNQQDLHVLKELIEAGKVTPVIDRTYPLSEAPEAIRYLEGGHARGKIVITV
jgi:NADPH:quinone reductase-like Zn-dependent oxidoreductase